MDKDHSTLRLQLSYLPCHVTEVFHICTLKIINTNPIMYSVNTHYYSLSTLAKIIAFLKMLFSYLKNVCMCECAYIYRYKYICKHLFMEET